MSPAGKSEAIENKVRAVRIERGLTQEELGRAVGLTRQSIIAIEKGRFTPSVHSALRLARSLDVPVEQLFWLVDGAPMGEEK